MIRKKLYIILLLLAALYGETKQTYGFDGIVIGADASARGGTYLGTDSSPQPVFQNYAFLNRRVDAKAALSVFQMLNEVNYLTAAYTQGNFSIGALTIQDSSGFMRDTSGNPGKSIGYNDTTIYAACGVGNDIFGGGVRLKHNSKTYSGIDVTARATNMDIAVFCRPHSQWTFGAEAVNLFGTNLEWSTGQTEELLKTYGIGGRYQTLQNLDLYTDIRLETEQSPLLSCGAEYNIGQNIFLRGGFRQVRETILTTRFSAGLGFHWQNFSLDYAYNPDTDLSGSVSHFVTLGWKL